MQQEPFTMQVSERSLRRVQVSVAALQVADQMAKATMETLQQMVGQARKSLDEALGAICDANDQTLPPEYTVSLNQASNTVTIAPESRSGAEEMGVSIMPGPAPVPVPEPSNGEVHAVEPTS